MTLEEAEIMTGAKWSVEERDEFPFEMVYYWLKWPDGTRHGAAMRKGFEDVGMVANAVVKWLGERHNASARDEKNNGL